MITDEMSQKEREALLRRYDFTVAWFWLVGSIVSTFCFISITTWQPTIKGEWWTELQPSAITFEGGTVAQFVLPISMCPDILMHPRSEVGVIDCLRAGQGVGYYWYHMPDDAQARVWKVCPSYPPLATISRILSDGTDGSYIVEDKNNGEWVEVTLPPYQNWPASLYNHWQCTSGKAPADGQWINLAPWVVIDQSFST